MRVPSGSRCVSKVGVAILTGLSTVNHVGALLRRSDANPSEVLVERHDPEADLAADLVLDGEDEVATALLQACGIRSERGLMLGSQLDQTECGLLNGCLVLALHNPAGPF